MSFINPEQEFLVNEIAQILIRYNETVSVAESTGGGLTAACLLSYPGASAYFVGGSVLYSHFIREHLVSVSKQDHDALGGSTPELIMRIAQQFQNITTTTWVIGEGGAAGPTMSHDGFPAGYTALVVNGPIQQTQAISTDSTHRVSNMTDFATYLLRLFLKVLQRYHQ